MPIDQQLLKILVCPATHQSLRLMNAAEIATLNSKVVGQTLKNARGEIVTETLSGALVREDQKVCYPIRDDIPIMMVDEAINL